jgi:hypothetical protein
MVLKLRGCIIVIFLRFLRIMVDSVNLKRSSIRILITHNKKQTVVKRYESRTTIAALVDDSSNLCDR